MVEVQHLGSLVEEYALGQTRRPTGVHEDHRIGFLGFDRHDRFASGDEVFVAEVVGNVGVADEHDVTERELGPALGDVPQEVFGEDLVDEGDRHPGIAEDVLQLLAGEAQVERVDDAGAEEPGVEQLQILMAVARHHGEPIGRLDVELSAHRVGQAQNPVAVLLERRVVVAVVERDLVWPPLEGGEQLAVEDEFFHLATCSSSVFTSTSICAAINATSGVLS